MDTLLFGAGCLYVTAAGRFSAAQRPWQAGLLVCLFVGYVFGLLAGRLAGWLAD